MFTKFVFQNSRFRLSLCQSTMNFSTLTCPHTGFTADVSKATNAQIINGLEISKKIKSLLRSEIKYLRNTFSPSHSARPKLGYVIVGDKPDSHLYVRMKKRTCRQIGIDTVGKKFHESTPQCEIEDYVKDLNSDPSVNGILVQLPLPDKYDSTRICDMISHEKDVDGIHPLNMGAMARHEDPFFTPCTPKGIMCLIKSVCPEIRGKKATVIGRSNIVGMPISMLLQKEFATVTLCHTYTQNLKDEISNADIVVSATGCPYLIKGDFIKSGAIVIDVGTQYIEDQSRKNGKRLVGDIDFQSVSTQAGYVTPVPGGVGPMTISMLMDNLVLAWKRNNFDHARDQVEALEMSKREFMFSSSISMDHNIF
ncbi:unnamed protein product [Moneuplotes crassus]|uniref:Methenyltetrahydrofolate cyclohydrolase n=1 Tax=Euplotes crassus TaxID=5936 RepID=A0AAD1XHT5_EUPCR|nr:unnamed protein product [Moneuplotes crassus]